MATQSLKHGDLISRYFERVLGVRQISSNNADLAPVSSPVANVANTALACLLVEVGVDAGSEGDSGRPSLQEMGARLVEAIRNEWLKQSLDHLPSIEWLRADEESWSKAVADRGASVALAIVCGARQSHAPNARVLHVSSFAEMKDSHVLKRDSWRAMQQRISAAAISAVNHTAQ